MAQKYDLIGDIHGYHEPLIALLEKLGYSNLNGHYSHSDKKVIFLGDYIDRGPGQKEVIEIVRAMVENASALAVMGNHEFNALCFHTENPDIPGAYLRDRSDKNINQHQAFLDAYQDNPEEMKESLDWFRTLPMWLDLEDLKVIHACWDKTSMDYITSNYSEEGLVCQKLLIDSCKNDSEPYRCLETILKGKEIPLPDGHKGIPDKAGIIRYHIRSRWWDNTATTYMDAYLGPEKVVDANKKPVSVWSYLPDEKIEGNLLISYSEKAAPVFLGHYWLEGKPERLAKNIACLDYSIAQERVA
ncbi:MAG: metallophosphoesterase, partial [Gammaproteobacteria bacterium]|nr:metallophosphoesterase [Gammaproteobacteria bacterium]